MNADLASHSINRLSLQIQLDSEQANVQKAWVAAGFEVAHDTDDGSHFLELAAYRRLGHEYHVLARLITGRDDNALMLLDYSEGEGTRTRELRANLGRLGGILDSLSVPCVVRCSATTTYDLENVAPLLALPLMRFTSSEAFFDEIRGVRFVRLAEDGEEVDNVALDMDEHGHLHVYAMTLFEAEVSARIPSIALRRLVSIRSKAVELK